MTKVILQKNNYRFSTSIPKELMLEVKKNTKNISEFCHLAIKEKIQRLNQRLNRIRCLNLLDEFPCISIEEKTIDILKRDRNE